MTQKEGIHRYEPLWEEWKVEKTIGIGSYGKVYKVSKQLGDEKVVSAVKHITIPTREQYEDAILSLGNNQETLNEYFKDIVNKFENEIRLLYKLRGNTNIVNYEDYMIKVKEDIGWDVLIKMEYLIPLNKLIEAKDLTKEMVLNLGIDICSGLKLCHDKGIIHRDIKDSNIFISEDNNFKIGDFGVATNLASEEAMTKIGTPYYMAPEVILNSSNKSYDKSVDIYSLGIVLYRLFNKLKFPFVPLDEKQITYNIKEVAQAKRVNGEALPKPCDADEDIWKIIKKACAYDPKDRYDNVDDLKFDLYNLIRRMRKDEKEQVVVKATGISRNNPYFTSNSKGEVSQNLSNDIILNLDNETEILDDDSTKLIDYDETELLDSNQNDLNNANLLKKKKRKLQILLISIIIAISSIFIYNGILSQKLYNKYLNIGIEYLENSRYKEAISEFEKAIKKGPKSTEARVYQAKAYIADEQYDSAIQVLEQAQNIDETNEELLKEILEILIGVDPDITYEFLERFIQAVGEENLSEEMKDILDSTNEVPSEPIVEPAPGTYVKPISVKLKLDKIKIGHTYYYTVDGSIPNKNSNKYSGKIDISETTTLKLIGYNKNNDSTEVISLEYAIHKEILKSLEDNIKKAETLIQKIEVGSEEGNISQLNYEKLQKTVNLAKDLLNEELIKNDDINNINNDIEGAIQEFKNNIIQPTDKNKLKNAINEAKSLYDNSTEGSSNGQYKSGSRAALLKAIKSAENINNDKLSTQNNIDNELAMLKNSIEKFKGNIVKNQGNSNIESKIKKKAWVNYNDDNIILYIKDNQVVFSIGFLEGYRCSIIDKTIKNNKITYNVDYSWGKGYITISLNGNNSIFVSVENFVEGSFLSGNYYIGNKDSIIDIAHNSGAIDEYDTEDNEYCLNRYDYFQFEYMGISKQDVRNYYDYYYNNGNY